MLADVEGASPLAKARRAADEAEAAAERARQLVCESPSQERLATLWLLEALARERRAAVLRAEADA